MLRFLLGLVLSLMLAVTPASAAELTGPKDELTELAPPPPVPEGWLTVPGINVEVHGHPEHEPRLIELARHSATAVPELSQQLGVPLGPRMAIFLAASDREFRELQPGRIPEWADATAWPERRSIFLRTERARGPGARPIAMVLDHEIVHVLLGSAFAPHEPPRWLQEGMAQVYAGEVDPQTAQKLARGLGGSGLYTLTELHHAFPRGPLEAELAYAQSADFVAWLRGTYGDDSMQRLVRELAAGRPIDAAIYNATGETLAAVDGAWRARLATSPGWAAALSVTDAVWVFTGLLAVVALVIRRRRVRRQMAELAREERERDAMLAEWWAARQQGLGLHENVH